MGFIDWLNWDLYQWQNVGIDLVPTHRFSWHPYIRHHCFTKKSHLNHLDEDENHLTLRSFLRTMSPLSVCYFAIFVFVWTSKNKNMWAPPSSSVNIWLHNGVKFPFWAHNREHLTFCTFQQGQNSFPVWRRHFKHIKRGIVSFLRCTYDLRAAWVRPFFNAL